MKRAVFPALIAATFAATDANAAGASYTLGAASDYVWRGVALTDRDLVYQAQARYDDARGFYAGAFVTPVDRVLYPVAATPDVRADFFLGVKAKTESGLGWDLGVDIVRYDESVANFTEAYFALSYGEWRASAAHDWNHDNTYLRFGGDFDVGSGVLIGLHVGRYDGNTVPGYYDYAASVATLVNNWRLALEFTDTDIEPAADATSSRTVLSVRRTW